MSRVALRMTVRRLRTMVRWLASADDSPGPLKKLLLASLLVAPFGVLVVLLRVAAWRRGPLREQASAHGFRFDCDLPDLIQLYLYVFGVWEPDLTAYVERTLERGDGFIDIGANIGYFSLLAARRVGPTGRVLAIEASPAIHATLERTLAMNALDGHVRTANVAASDQPGTLTIYHGPSTNIGLSTTVAQRGFEAAAHVPANTLERIATEAELAAARLIKIDVEGGEPAVLDGLVAALPRLRPDVEIMVELSPHWWSDRNRTVGDLLRPFLAAGFRAYSLPNNYWPWRYLWPDAVARPRRLLAGFEAKRDRLDLVLSRRDAPEL